MERCQTCAATERENLGCELQGGVITKVEEAKIKNKKLQNQIRQHFWYTIKMLKCKTDGFYCISNQSLTWNTSLNKLKITLKWFWCVMNRWTFQMFQLIAGSLVCIIFNFASNNKTDWQMKYFFFLKLLNTISLKHQADCDHENTSSFFLVIRRLVLITFRRKVKRFRLTHVVFPISDLHSLPFVSEPSGGR